MANKIIVHACGGCGVNIADKVLTKVSGLGSGFSELEFNYIDSSEADFEHIEHKLGDFFAISNDSYIQDKINGAGGDRRLVKDAVESSLPRYLEINKFKKQTNVFHMIVHSCSGGTGSTFGPMLADRLMKLNIPVILFLVGDSSDGLKADNTLKVLKTYDNIASRNKQCLLSYYVDNNNIKDESGNVIRDVLKREKAANEKILHSVGILSCFLSGENKTIDSTDMSNFISQSHYQSLNVKPQLYTITSHDKKIILPEGAHVTGIRCLVVTGEEEITIDYDTDHFKHGRIIDENAINKMGKIVPIFLVTSTGLIQAASTQLANVVEEIKAKQEAQKVLKIAEVTNAEVTEEGFLF